MLWKVSFGCWVTWSISSWQKCYKSVFFFNFTKLQFLNNKIYSYTKNNYLALGNLVFWSISSFKTKSKHLSQFFWWEINLRELRGFILQKIWALVAGRQKKKVLPLITRLGKEETLIILLSAWDRSRDSKAKRNLSKHMWWAFHVSLLVTFLGQKSLKTLRMFALLKASLVGFIYIFSSLFSNSFTFKTIYILNIKVVYLHLE